MDGRYHDGAGDTMTCHTAPVELVSTPTHVEMGAVETETYRYKHIILEVGDSCGLWVHESLYAPGDVLRALIEGYRKGVSPA